MASAAMGDARFEPHYARVKRARDPVREIRAMSDEDVIAALGGASRASDAYLANVLTTEALNRVRRSSAVIGHLGEGVIALDPGLRIAFANPAAERALGASPGKLVGRPVHEAVHACADLMACPFLACLEAARGTPCPDDVFAASDGRPIPVSYLVTPITMHGERVGTVFIFWDVSERQQRERALLESEERYRLLIELSPEPIAVHVQGKLAYLNPAGVQALGARRAEDLVGRPVIDFVHPDSRPFVAERMRLLASGERALPLARERLLRLDGSAFDAEVRAWVTTFEGAPAVQLALRPLN